MAGTITISNHIQAKKSGLIGALRLAWTSDTGGDVNGTTFVFNGRIERIVTNPGATAPTANYDVVINDEDAIDLAQGLLANRHTSNSEEVTPLVGDGTTTDKLVAHAGTIEPQVSNAGASKVGEIIIHYSR